MKTLMISLFMLSLGSNAFAYRDATYSCKNSVAELPNNIYKIETVRVGSGSLPYIEITRYLKNGEEVRTMTAKGIGSVHSSRPGSELLQIGSISLEFFNGEFINCKQ